MVLVDKHPVIMVCCMRNFHRACGVDWLLEAMERESLKSKKSDIVKQFDMITVSLNRKEKLGIPCVYRTICDKVLPINFGYGTECYAHPGVKSPGFSWATPFPSYPHFFP